MSRSVDVTGYAHRRYADSLSEFGTPVHLPRCQGWILRRQIPQTQCWDAMGCYPLFTCTAWNRLADDLEQLGTDTVSVGLVTDPFGDWTEETLSRYFPDRCDVFKEHYVTDLTQPVNQFVSSHHRRNTRKAAAVVDVAVSKEPSRQLAIWCSLYEALIQRHRIRGIARFSHTAFDQQLRVPGMVALRAIYQEEVVSMTLWYEQDRACYYHLGASNETGYRLRAPYALFDFAIDFFAKRGHHWLNLGAGAGVDVPSIGLERFKRGWATGTRPAYFCGRILQNSSYERLSKNIPQTCSSTFFPAYRHGELART